MLKVENLVTPSPEQWKRINEFPKYYISNKGRVYSLYTKKIIKTRISQDGYERVNLCKDRKRTTQLVHRLVAENFIPNPEKKNQVNHKDLNRHNNCVNNLEWVTNYENQIYSEDKRTIKTHFSSEKEREKIRYKYFENNMSINEIAQEYQMSYGGVFHIIRQDDRYISRKQKRESNVEQIVRLYKTGLYSIEELSELVPLSKNTILEILKQESCNKKELNKNKFEEIYHKHKEGLSNREIALSLGLTTKYVWSVLRRHKC